VNRHSMHGDWLNPHAGCHKFANVSSARQEARPTLIASLLLENPRLPAFTTSLLSSILHKGF